MEKLKILNICNISKVDDHELGGQENKITLIDDFKWFLSEEFNEIRNTN